MHVKPRLALIGAASVLALTLNPAAAMADHGNGNDLIRGDFQGIAAKMVLPGFDNLLGGGRDWIIDRGEVRVRASGRTDVRIEGLQIPEFAGPGAPARNPVTSITVSLWCNHMLAAQSAPEPMTDPEGDAEFRTTLDVPSSCPSAAAFVNPGGNPAVFISFAFNDHDD